MSLVHTVMCVHVCMCTCVVSSIPLKHGVCVTHMPQHAPSVIERLLQAYLQNLRQFPIDQRDRMSHSCQAGCTNHEGIVRIYPKSAFQF